MNRKVHDSPIDRIAFVREIVIGRMRAHARKLRLGILPRHRMMPVLAGLIEDSNILRAIRTGEPSP